MSPLTRLLTTASIIALTGCAGGLGGIPKVTYYPDDNHSSQNTVVETHAHDTYETRHYEALANFDIDIDTFTYKTGRNPSELLLILHGPNKHKLLRTLTYTQAHTEITGYYDPHIDVKDDPMYRKLPDHDREKVNALESVKKTCAPKFSIAVGKPHAGTSTTKSGNQFCERSNLRNAWNLLTAQNLTGEADPKKLMQDINDFEAKSCDIKSGEMAMLTSYNRETGSFKAKCTFSFPDELPIYPRDTSNLCREFDNSALTPGSHRMLCYIEKAKESEAEIINLKDNICKSLGYNDIKLDTHMQQNFTGDDTEVITAVCK